MRPLQLNRDFSPASSAPPRNISGKNPGKNPVSFWRRRPALLWFLFLVPLLLYLPSLRNGFVYDDQVLIVEEARPEGWGDVADTFRERHFPTVPYYRPVLRLSFRFQKFLHGETAWPYHLVNALLAGLAAVAAFRLLNRPAFGLSRCVAAVTALLWALHPALSSCVYPICSGRETLLPSIFILLGMEAWMRPGLLRGLTALAWFVLALFSKEQAIVLPALFLLSDGLDLDGERRRTHFRSFAWRYVIIGGVLAGYLALRWTLFHGGEFTLNTERPELPLFSYLYALQTAFFPFVPLVYEPPAAVWFSWPKTLAALGLTGGLLFGALRLGLHRRLLFWVAWFLILQAPTANFLEQEALFDERYTALASLALFAIAAGIYTRLPSLSRRLRRSLRCALVLLALGWAAISLSRGRFFHDDPTFIAQWIRANPDSVDALVNHAKYALDRGDHETARHAAARAVRLAPELPDAHYNFGLASYHLGDLETAIAAYRRTLEIDPEYDAHYNLALALADAGAPRKALYHYRQALEQNPQHVDAHYNLGLLLARSGDYEAALPFFQEAADLDPSDAESVYNLGVALERLRRMDEAEQAYRKALRRDPEHTGALFNLGLQCLRRKRFQESVALFERILAIDPGDKEALRYRDAAREQL